MFGKCFCDWTFLAALKFTLSSSSRVCAGLSILLVQGEAPVLLFLELFFICFMGCLSRPPSGMLEMTLSLRLSAACVPVSLPLPSLSADCLYLSISRSHHAVELFTVPCLASWVLLLAKLKKTKNKQKKHVLASWICCHLSASPHKVSVRLKKRAQKFNGPLMCFEKTIISLSGLVSCHSFYYAIFKRNVFLW